MERAISYYNRVMLHYERTHATSRCEKLLSELIAMHETEAGRRAGASLSSLEGRSPSHDTSIATVPSVSCALPPTASLYRRRGEALIRLGNIPEAETNLNRALELCGLPMAALDMWTSFSSSSRPMLRKRNLLQQLIDHHNHRLDLLSAAAKTAPLTVRLAMDELFGRSFGEHEMYFASGEARAHLNHLVAVGRLHKRFDDCGIDIYETKNAVTA